MTITKGFVSNRYSDADLLEFKQLLEIKLKKAKSQLESLQSTLSETTESKDREGDWMDDTSTSNDVQLLELMVGRQHKHILDLTKALQRISNKSYGICVISGKLIDKRRLKAVLTTTKSLVSKMMVEKPIKKRVYDEDEESDLKKTPSSSVPTERKIITKVIKRSGTPRKVEGADMEVEGKEEMDDLYMDYASAAVDFEDLLADDLGLE